MYVQYGTFVFITAKKKFSFRGCGWKPIDTKQWTADKQSWILAIDNLFSQILGGDFLPYVYDKDKGTSVDLHAMNALVEYDHDEWEKSYLERKGSFLKDTSSEKQTKLKCQQSLAPTQLPFIGAQTTQAIKLDIDNSSHDVLAKCLDPTPASKEVLNIISDDEDEAEETTGHSDGSAQQPSFQLSSALFKAATRAELAALDSVIPPILPSTGSIPPFHVQVSDSNLVFTDPFSLVHRPCETVVGAAEEIMNEQKRKGNHPSGIVVQGLGQFSEQGLRILRQFCEISKTRGKIAAEAHWLSNIQCPSHELALFQDFLWNRPMTSVVLRCGNKAIDVLSFCDLVGERYIDSFVIDVCINKYMEESYSQGRQDTMFFPTEFFHWMTCDDKVFKLRQLEERASHFTTLSTLQQILVPVHMPNHWGLIYVNLAGQLLHFDDGLTSHVPSTALPSIKEALNLLLEMHPNHPSFQTKFWQSSQGFSRFGMPSQVPVDKKMIGAGSCGIGVIMAARDFIQKGQCTVNNFRWRYCDMDKHRKDLMLQILYWAGHNP